jgi:CheY-like chemotaxis protein
VLPAAAEQKFVEALSRRFPKHIGAVLSKAVTLGDPVVSEEWELTPGTYVATLSCERPTPREFYFVLERASAIVAGGLLVMMQEKVIREKVQQLDLTGEDIDATGECVNQFSSVLNDTFHDDLGLETHAVFVGGDVLGKAHEGKFLVVRWPLGIAGLHDGWMEVVIPRDLLTQPDAHADPEAPPRGVELSAEEIDALREATREGFAGADGRVAILVGSERHRGPWEEVLAQSGISGDFAHDLQAIRRMCRGGEATMVLVDCDACPSGGLPALARLNAWADLGVPVVVAASSPTRRHLVSCLAGGAVSYLVKPLDPVRLAEQLAQVRGTWQEAAPLA